MIYLADAPNLVLASLIFAFVCGNRGWSLAAFTVYYAGIRWIVYREGQDAFPFTVQYQILVAAVCLAVIYWSPKIFAAARTQVVARFDSLGLLFDDRRGVLISKLWTSTVLATSTVGHMRYFGLGYPSENFYVSWAVNVVFFSVIGLAAALVSLRLPHKEEFSSRLGILFAGTDNVDNEFRQSALSHISDEIKKLGLAVSKINRKMVVDAYDPDYDAYRATVTVTTTMVSLFGDVDARDQVQFSVTPDEFKGCKRTPNPVGQVVSLFVNGEEKIVGNPRPIEVGQENGFPEIFSVGNDAVQFTFKYWCWFQCGETFLYSSKRFCRDFNVKIINRILQEQDSKLTVCRPRPGKAGEFDRKSLIYGEEWDIVNFRDLEPHLEKELFTLERPDSAVLHEDASVPAATEPGEKACQIGPMR